MTDRGVSIAGVLERCALRLSILLLSAASVGAVLPAASSATILPPWGSDLSVTPSLDSANGAYASTATGPTTAISPNPHEAEDLGIWNAGDTAPQGGQVLQVKVKGCAIENANVPAEDSNGNGAANGEQYSQSVPVNTVLFQTLEPRNDDWTATTTSGQFLVPFCSNSANPADQSAAVNTSTISTYQPIHMCIAAGDQVAFHDIGGFIPDGTSGDGGGPWYPAGIPMDVIAQDSSSTVDSFVGVGAGTYGRGIYGPAEPDQSASGYATNSHEQVMLQVIEGVGDDAYGLCPGGDANEPTNSNAVTCVERHTNPGDPYGTCDAEDEPVYPPANNSAPTITPCNPGVTSSCQPDSARLQEGQRLDATPGTWTRSPYGYMYQWVDCDSSGANCRPILGNAGTQTYYYVTSHDIGHTIELQIWASNDANTEGPASSAPTPIVAAPPAPVITNLKLNPPTFYSAKGSTITYTDSQAATTTLKVIDAKTGAVVKTLTNSDRASQYGGNGFHVGGIPAGRYELEATPVFEGTAGHMVTLPFTVKASTTIAPPPNKKSKSKSKKKPKPKKTKKRTTKKHSTRHLPRDEGLTPATLAALF